MKPTFLPSLVALLLPGLTGPSNLLGATAILNPASDSYVNESNPAGNNNNAWLAAGRSPAEFTPRYRSLLRFDLSGIPSNATVSSAVLRLNLQAVEGGATAGIELRRVLASWTSTTLTWNNQPPATTPVITTTVGTTRGADYNWPITGLAQGWVSGQYSNYGLTLRIVNEATATATRTFASGSHATSSIRPELIVTYTLPPDINVVPTFLAFGNQSVGTSSAAQTVTVQNYGGSDLTVSSIASSSADFVVTVPGGLPATLVTNSSLMFQVRFAPTSSGSKSASLTITSNDPDEPERVVSCTGTGAAPRIVATPQSLVFGNVIVATTARRDLKLKNDGNANLIVSSITGTNPVFRLEGSPSFPLTLAPGQELTLPVAYTPLSVRQDFDRLRIGNNDPFSPEVFVEMGGAGEPPACDAAGPLPLRITVNGDERKIWNVERGGVKFWNFEGRDYEKAASDNYPDPYEVLLNRALCTEHFVVYYASEGVGWMTLQAAGDLASALEEGWQALVRDQGFRSPADLQPEGRYELFQNFERIPVLFADPAGGLNGAANGAPYITLRPTLTSASETPIHELFHIVIDGYTRYDPAWLNEGLARWSQQFKPGADFPCNDSDFMQMNHDFLTRNYCDTAPWFQYLGLKYSEENPPDGSDVIRTILEEMAEVNDRDGTMLSFERALDRLDGARLSGHGTAFAEWAGGNYVNDTEDPATMRAGAPLIPRYKEGGWIAPGGNRYLFREYTFALSCANTVTIQIRAAADDRAVEGDDDDLRVVLDGEVLGDWNTANAFDGDELPGGMKTLHLVRANLAAGTHTIRLEADVRPVFYSLTVFEGEVPLLLPSSPEVTLNGAPYPTYTFDVAADAPDVTVLMTGVVGDDSEYARLYLDGNPREIDNETLSGRDLAGDLATVEVHFTGLASRTHTLEIRGRGQIRDLVAYATPAQPPLLKVRTCKLSPWSAGYQVVPVTAAFFDLDHQDFPGATDAVSFRFNTIQWDDGLTPPFTELIRVAADGTKRLSSFRTRQFDVQRGYSADNLEALGEDGRLVHVTTATSFGGTYELVVTRVAPQPDRYDCAPLGDPPNNHFADATVLPNAPGGDEWTVSDDALQRVWRMRVRDLNFHAPTDVDYFCVELPAEALDDCNAVEGDCLRLGEGRLRIRVHGAQRVIKVDAEGQEIERHDNFLEYGCHETGRRACFAVVGSPDEARDYRMWITYVRPDEGAAHLLGELARVFCDEPGPLPPLPPARDVIIPDDEEVQEFSLAGPPCDPIVCTWEFNNYLLFNWGETRVLELEFQHEVADGFQFELLDSRLNVMARAERPAAPGSPARDAPGQTITQRLRHSSLPAGLYLIHVRGSRLDSLYTVRFVTPALPSLRMTRVGDNVRLAWPNPSTGFHLQHAMSLTPPEAWADVTITPVVVGEERQVTLPMGSTRRFFRLRKP